jgi:adenylate cyclase
MSGLAKAFCFGFLLGIIGVAVSFFQFAHDAEEDIGLGLLFKLRGVRKAPADVVVVSIDRESSEHLNLPDNPDKWPRSLYGRLVEALVRNGARVITFDVYFTEPGAPEEDSQLAAAIMTAGNVVLAEPLKAVELPAEDVSGASVTAHRVVRILKPIPPLAQSAAATAPFVLPGIPFKVNQYWTFQSSAGDWPTFPVVAFQLYALGAYDEFTRLLAQAAPRHAAKLPADALTVIAAKGAASLVRDIRQIFESDPSLAGKMVEGLEASGLAARDREKYRLLKSLVHMYAGADRRYLNYYGHPRTLPTIPFYRVLQPREASTGAGQIDFKDKAVFVGLSEILLTERRDSFYTVFSQANGVFISGVEIAATAFSNLLDDRPVRPIASHSYLLLILCSGVLVGVVCRMAAALTALLALAGLSILYLIVAEYQFNARGIWYPVTAPLLLQVPLGFFGAVLWNYFETDKERQNIRKALAYYIPDEMVHQVAKNVVDMKRGGQIEYGVCLFTDAAGYTNLSETMDPGELGDFMHRYFEATFEPVKQNGGMVVDVEGDAVLALWKGARPEATLRNQACHAALGIAKAVHQFNQSLDDRKLPTRVGVHAGQILLGNIGAGNHYRYGPSGDTVNTASRMDGLNKYLETEILVSEEVIAGLDGFLTRPVGKFLLKGKTNAVVVHELICGIEEAGAKQRKACETFADALGSFRKKRWNEARDRFIHCIEDSGGDGPSRFYLKLCVQYQDRPPEEPWDGVIQLEEK